MKRLITSAVALTLIMGGGALAQDRDKHGGGGKHQGQQQQQNPKHQGGGGGGGGGGHKDHDKGGGRGGGGGHHDRNAGGGGGGGGGGRDVDRRDDRRGHDANRNDRRNDRNPNWNRKDNRGQNWNRGGRDRPRNFDRRHYQRNVWAQHRFRRGVYHRPNGWYYRRWTYGQILPFAFFAQDYWLNDWYSYDLPVPPYGYEWVRYGDDAILVDVRTGMILQVMYGVFY
jgi:Ni/Co efflux regulator RcnB